MTDADMARASDKFLVHDMVRASSYAEESLGLSVGIVVGFSTKRGDCVRVLLPRHKAPGVYHMDFWDVECRLETQS